MIGRTYVGTSGWSYSDWAERFYPSRRVLQTAALPYYSSCFETAEINATFYRHPSESTVAGWYRDSPPDFIFAWKASNYLTHKRLLKGDLSDSLSMLRQAHLGLREKGGPILFQLPPRLRIDLPRLEAFLVQWRAACMLRTVVEFRHRSWYTRATYDLLQRYQIAFCISDHADAPSVLAVTTDFAYLRLHGISGQYFGRYPPNFLRSLSIDLRDLNRQGRDAYVFLDNDHQAAATADAAYLDGLLWAHKRRREWKGSALVGPAVVPPTNRRAASTPY